MLRLVLLSRSILNKEGVGCQVLGVGGSWVMGIPLLELRTPNSALCTFHSLHSLDSPTIDFHIPDMVNL
jgi:hypothetical protein